jgi:hypothetical protein
MEDPHKAAQDGFVQSFEGVNIKPDYHYADYPAKGGLDLIFVPGVRKPKLPPYLPRSFPLAPFATPKSQLIVAKLPKKWISFCLSPRGEWA